MPDAELRAVWHPGSASARAPHYKLTSTRDRIPALECRACSEKPPARPNQTIARELARIRGKGTVYDGGVRDLRCGLNESRCWCSAILHGRRSTCSGFSADFNPLRQQSLPS